MTLVPSGEKFRAGFFARANPDGAITIARVRCREDSRWQADGVVGPTGRFRSRQSCARTSRGYRSPICLISPLSIRSIGLKINPVRRSYFSRRK